MFRPHGSRPSGDFRRDVLLQIVLPVLIGILAGVLIIAIYAK